MILDKLHQYFIDHGFQKIRVNVDKIHIYSTTFQNERYVLSIYEVIKGQEFTKEQYGNFQNQIYQNFINTDERVHFLTIVYTEDLERSREMTGQDNYVWYLDARSKRLIIYESHKEDFLGLQKEIDDLLNDTFIKEEWDRGESTAYSENQVHDSKALSKSSLFTVILILINVLAFLGMEIIGSTEDLYYMLDKGALYWPSIQFDHEYYRFITYMFLHFGFGHLANNMIVLYFLGSKLEQIVGKVKFLILYLSSGFLAGVASIGYNMLKNNNIISAGASGAIFGVVGAMGFIVAINKGRIKDISARQITIFVILSLYNGLTSQGIDNVAHIGGMLSGAIIAAILYRRQKTNTERG